MKFVTSTLSSLLLVGLTLGVQSAQAWTIQENFDSQTSGSAPKTSGVEYLSKTYTASTHYGSSGLGAQLGITGGTSGSSDFGAYIYFPSVLKEGNEVWYRVRTYMPSTFDYQSSTFALKFMRVHTTAGATTTNRGYMDTYINPDGSYLYQNEFYNNQAHENFLSQTLTSLTSLLTGVTKASWETYEVYVKFSATAGQGIYRVWKNGNLVYQNTKWPTLASSSDQSDMALLFTYWNGNAPQTQTMYVDDLIVTSDKPSAIDAYGNAFIGLGGSRPEAPVLTIQ